MIDLIVLQRMPLSPGVPGPHPLQCIQVYPRSGNC
jgi:hypothetical protein